MEVPVARSPRGERSENLIGRVVARLRHHVLWDALLLFVPPAAVLIYIVTTLVRGAWLSPLAAALAVSLIIGFGALAGYLRRRPLVPSTRLAAHLMDQRSGAKDHFLTLTTINPANEPEAFVTRLRQQSESFVDRVSLKRDFPYQLKHSAYWSLGGSVLAAILIHLLLPLALPGRAVAVVPDRLRELAKQMASHPDLRALAKELEAVATRLDDPNLSAEEKRALVQQLEQKIQERQKRPEQKDNGDLLARASSALTGQDQQQGTSGQQQKEQQKGAGGIQTNAPQEGRGENKQRQAGSGDGRGESSEQLNRGTDQGKSTTSNPKERGDEKSPLSEANNDQNRPDPNQPGKDPEKEKTAKNQGGSKEGAGKEQASPEPPQGSSPKDRFYKAGEGKEGLKGAGYVTVQLPEDLMADAKGESRATKDSRDSRPRSQVPVSNVPLPPHLPNAPTEKQPLPIEYRGIIR
jgi:hypothetical protein